MSLFANAATGSTAALLVLVLLVFLFDLVRGGLKGENQSPSWLNALKTQAKLLALVLVGGAVAFGLAALAALNLAQQAGFFFAAVLITYCLAVLPFKPVMRTNLHLGLACAIALWAAPNTLIYSATAYMAGLIVMRLVLNLMRAKETRLDDIAPAFVYLSGLLFFQLPATWVLLVWSQPAAASAWFLPAFIKLP